MGAGNETLGGIRQGVRMRILLKAVTLGGPQPQGKYRLGKNCPLAQQGNNKECLSLLGLRFKTYPLRNQNSGPVSHIGFSLNLYYPGAWKTPKAKALIKNGSQTDDSFHLPGEVNTAPLRRDSSVIWDERYFMAHTSHSEDEGKACHRHESEHNDC